MHVHDDPRIEAGSFEISEAWMDRNSWALGVLHGLANHNQRRMMERNWPAIARAVRDAPTKGLSCDMGETNLRTFLVAGRLLWTMSRGDDQISFLSYEQSDDEWWGGAVQSLEAPLSVALAMIEDCATHVVALQPDRKVKIV